MKHNLKIGEALVVYARWLDEHYGVPPSVREYMAELGINSTSAAAQWLEKLEWAGYLKHAIPGRADRIAANDLVVTDAGYMLLLEQREGVPA